MHHKSTQRGFSTIHLIVFLLVMSLAQVGSMHYQTKHLAQTNGKIIGGMLASIRDAVDDYLKTWGANIAAGKPIVSGSTTVSIPLSPSLDELTALGHLHAVVTAPPHGGDWKIVIETNPSTCTLPGPCNLASSVYASTPLTRGGDTTKVDQWAIDAAIGVIGSDGGYSDANDPGTILGAGGWARPNKNGSVAGTLYAIGGYGSITYTALKNIGDTCTVAGSVATATSGQQLICRGTPLAYMSTLNALPSYRVGEKLTVRDGDTVTKPTCDNGGTPAYSFEMNQTGVDVAVAPPRQIQYAAMQDMGTSWQVKIKLKDNSGDVSANGYNITSIVHLECYYPS